ncbi:MAG: excinuclease ABC subunit C, partial [uncultured bacterium (gcode 4)]
MNIQYLDIQLKKLPDEPGIYLFFNPKKELIYVGKATSLKSRVSSYFRGSLSPSGSGRSPSRPIEQMIHEVVDIKWKTTDSVLEAIILEANSIKEKQPKYNVLGRDDKSWNYIVIAKGEYPLVTTLRQHEYVQKKLEKSTKASVFPENLKLEEYAYVFGPYPGLNTTATMKLLRKLFYISDCQKQKNQ